MVGGEGGVVEEVERLPALALGDAVGRDLAVEVLGAVDVPGVAEVLVVLRACRRGRTCRGGRPCRARPGPAGPCRRRRTSSSSRASGRRCPSACGSSTRRGRAPARARACARWKARKSEHCLPCDVDDLDVLALAHLVGERGRLVDAEVEPRLRQRRAAARPRFGPRRRPLDLDDQRGRRPVAVDDPAPGAATTAASRSTSKDCDSPGAARRRRTAGSRRRPGPPALGEQRVAGASGRRQAPLGSASSTDSSAGCPPSGSITVNRRRRWTRTPVAPPGRTHHDSNERSTGFSPATRAGADGHDAQLARSLRLVLLGLRHAAARPAPACRRRRAS